MKRALPRKTSPSGPADNLGGQGPTTILTILTILLLYYEYTTTALERRAWGREV